MLICNLLLELKYMIEKKIKPFMSCNYHALEVYKNAMNNKDLSTLVELIRIDS